MKGSTMRLQTSVQSAGVAPEMNLRNSAKARKHAGENFTMALKPTKGNCVLQKKTTLSCETYICLRYVTCHYVFVHDLLMRIISPHLSASSCMKGLLNCHSRVLSEGVKGASWRVWGVRCVQHSRGSNPLPLTSVSLLPKQSTRLAKLHWIVKWNCLQQWNTLFWQLIYVSSNTKKGIPDNVQTVFVEHVVITFKGIS